MPTKFYIRFFSSLEISDGEKSLTQNEIRSDMAVKLLAYLILHHERSCTISELSDALWPDGVSVNPTGALKNLAYRLRNILKTVWPDENFILTGKGSYAWNSELKLEIDSELLKDKCKEALDTPNVEEKIRILKDGFLLYRGKFLKDYNSEHWVMPRTAYFESQYLDLTQRLSSLLFGEEQYEEMERICLDALTKEPLDENLHALVIRAYLAENKIEDAERHYHKAEKILYDNLGIGPSAELKALYDKVMEQNHDQEMDLGLIQNELKEEPAEGAFYCEYGIFKKVYELDARRLERMGMTVHISLLTLYTDDGMQSSDPKYLELMEKAMRQMKDVVIQSLRAGDIFTRYSVNQYLIMLPSCPYEQAKKVMERIFKNYEQVRRRAKVRMQYSLKAMDWMERHMDAEIHMYQTPSVIRLCIDGVREGNRDFYGRLGGVGLKNCYSFSNVSDFMVQTDKLLNLIGKPQASSVRRSFGNTQEGASYQPEPQFLRPVKEVEAMVGDLKTYNVKIQTRYHNTWQGLLFSEHGERIGGFDSALELIRMIVEKNDKH